MCVYSIFWRSLLEYYLCHLWIRLFIYKIQGYPCNFPCVLSVGCAMSLYGIPRPHTLTLSMQGITADGYSTYTIRQVKDVSTIHALRPQWNLLLAQQLVGLYVFAAACYTCNVNIRPDWINQQVMWTVDVDFSRGVFHSTNSSRPACLRSKV